MAEDHGKRSIDEPLRYIFPTQGVCPAEIHFSLKRDVLSGVRFAGGGCPGNAQLVSRLLEGMPVASALEALKGIVCRNRTSCPHQLAQAIRSAAAGELTPASTLRLRDDPQPCRRIGLIGDIDGDGGVLLQLAEPMRAAGIQRCYCVGNVNGESQTQDSLPKALRQSGVVALLGERDWLALQASAEDTGANRRLHDCLLQMPHLVRFRLGERTGVCFYGEYLQRMPGYSDFDPFALEMNMVCGLSDFMRDPSVFPALAAMTPQFSAQIVVFGQTRRWGHWQVGNVDFVGAGPASGSAGLLQWGLLEIRQDRLHLETRETPCESTRGKGKRLKER